jgi:Ca2+-binding RTX toxin-like protein
LHVTPGDGSDVILGDNGLITREFLSEGRFDWKRYPVPFDDVIRDIQLFDDLDRIGGNDRMYGDDGRDVMFGQRGDDHLNGGPGDDDMVGGLGIDYLVGGPGNDVMLGDVGFILRALNPDGTARVNANGSHHRDVYLEEVAMLIGRIDLDTTPLRDPDPDLAEKIMRADLILLVGGYQHGGVAKHLHPDSVPGTPACC